MPEAKLLLKVTLLNVLPPDVMVWAAMPLNVTVDVLAVKVPPAEFVKLPEMETDEEPKSAEL